MKSSTEERGKRTNPMARTRQLLSEIKGGLTKKNRGQAGGSFFGSENWPTLEVSEDDDEILVKAEIPGMTRDDIDISYVEGSLRIEGEKKEESENKDRDFYYKESRYGNFTRIVPVGTHVDWEKAKADYRNGILKVEIPKLPGEGKSKRITIA